MSTTTTSNPHWPALREGTAHDWQTLASLRRIDTAACRIADGAGLLRFGKWKGTPAWFITDEDRLNAQARRMDGLPWPAINAKAQTLPGARAGWPVGLRTGQHYPALLIVEGSSDLLAALHFIVRTRDPVTWFPVAMLGAAQNIPADALPILAGKRVRLYPHDDDAGHKGASKWGRQLASVGCEVDWFDFHDLRKADGLPVNDLNDAALIHPDDAHKLEGLLP